VPEHTIRESFGADVLPAIGEEALRTPPLSPPAPPLARPVPPPPPQGVPPGPAPFTTTPRPGPLPSPGVPGSELRGAGFWVRVAAMLVDWLWMAALAMGVSFAFGGPGSGTGRTVLSLAWLLLWLLVPLLGWAIAGATPGKALLGLRVVAAGRQRGLGLVVAFLRLCGFMVSGIFGLGFLMVAFTKDRRALHDHLAGTMVVKR
jgi:uncharacterized RDD family membrane protein YckC